MRNEYFSHIVHKLPEPPPPKEEESTPIEQASIKLAKAAELAELLMPISPNQILMELVIDLIREAKELIDPDIEFAF